MPGMWAQACALLLGLPAGSPALVAVLVGVLLAVGACLPRVLRQVTPAGPAAAAHDRLRALARRGVPGLRDPDAAGHTCSRAPSGLLPAV